MLYLVECVTVYDIRTVRNVAMVQWSDSLEKDFFFDSIRIDKGVLLEALRLLLHKRLFAEMLVHGTEDFLFRTGYSQVRKDSAAVDSNGVRVVRLYCSHVCISLNVAVIVVYGHGTIIGFLVYDTKIDNFVFVPKYIDLITDSRDITTLAGEVSVDNKFGIRVIGG